MTGAIVKPSRKAQVIDLAERAGWTLLQAGIGEGVVQLAADNVPAWAAWAVPLIATGLSLAKGALAQKFGKGTAATVPAKDEATPPTAPGRHEAAEHD